MGSTPSFLEPQKSVPQVIHYHQAPMQTKRARIKNARIYPTSSFRGVAIRTSSRFYLKGKKESYPKKAAEKDDYTAHQQNPTGAQV